MVDLKYQTHIGTDMFQHKQHVNRGIQYKQANESVSKQRNECAC